VTLRIYGIGPLQTATEILAHNRLAGF